MKKTAVAILALSGLLLMACLGMGILKARLDTAGQNLLREETAHNGTKREYAKDKGLWLLDQKSANATIAGLQKQVNGTMAARDEARKAEIARFELFTNAATAAAKPTEVVDDATSGKAVQHLNNAFDRAGGL